MAVIKVNNGHFTFTLDDPYIHFALAQNIIQGHYGINLNEYSAPASSILWPILISPLMLLGNELTISYSVLILNLLLAIATIFIYWKTVTLALKAAGNESNWSNQLVAFSLIFFLTFNTNLIGIAFVGMEHSLQVLLSAIIVYGTLKVFCDNEPDWWLFAAIALAPLIRYENATIAYPIALLLFLRGYFVRSTIAVLISFAGIFGFGFYLMSLGLDFFPSSIKAKSKVLTSAESSQIVQFIKTLIITLENNLNLREGFLYILPVFAIIIFSFNNRIAWKFRLLALTMILAAILHVILGQFGWFGRYEIYSMAALLMVAIFLYIDKINELLSRTGIFAGCCLILVFSLLSSMQYLKENSFIPGAANNIFSQQYQTHRFITEFYKKPAAINDLGYPSFNNDQYILDLVGLGSYESLNRYRNEDTTLWIGDMVDRYNIQLITIYETWFPDIPPHWKKVAEHSFTSKKITAADNKVSYFTVNCESHKEITQLLFEYEKTKPDNIELEFFECL